MTAMTFTEVAPDRADTLMDDDRWALEPKYDGVRTLVEVDSEGVRLLNRGGKPLSAASTNAHRPALVKAFTGVLLGAWTFDGELLDDGVLIIFDLSRAVAPDGTKIVSETTPFRDRREVLEKVLTTVGWDTPDSVVRVATHVRGGDKRVLHDTILETGGEGVMLKDLDAGYEHKRTKTAGYKVKFTSTVDAVVIARDVDGKENAVLGLVKDGLVYEVGRCSMIGKPETKVGDVVEVRYLYVGAGGRLVQPRLVRVRGDKAPQECGTDQLAGTEVKKWVA